MSPKTKVVTDDADASLSLYHLLDPETRACPYPLYHRLRERDPVHWDAYLHAWVVTRYDDVVTVLQQFSAERSLTPEQLTALGLSELNPIAQVLIRQMLFMDPPAHNRLRALAAAAFTPARVENLRQHIQEITDSLIDTVLPRGRMDVIADLANLLPATVTAELMGVPVADRDQLKEWSIDFSEMLGNFQHNPGRTSRMLQVVEEMTSYYRARMKELENYPKAGVVYALMCAEVNGDRLTEEEVIANSIITMTGGQETTTNLIGNGLLALMQNPEELELGGKLIRKRQAVIAMLGAGNHDPARFADPDRLDVTRKDNRHLAFGWASHYCFGAPLARVEGQIAFSTLLQRLLDLKLEPVALVWRHNMIFRGLERLPISFRPAGETAAAASSTDVAR